MRTNSKAAIAACLVVAAATVLTACGGSSGGGSSSSGAPPVSSGSSSDSGSPDSTTGYNAAANNVIRPSTKTGGTLNLLTSSDCDSWDPQRTYYGWCWNMQRLFTRTLVGYSKVNGSKFVLAPDMATSLGKHNANFTQWTYTLKPGLKYSNGQPIKPLDIKYGIERVFAADVINGGPSQYFTNTIQHPASYAGPYKDGDLSTIKTTANSITFNLSKPVSDWDYRMALPTAAPVPYKVEGGPGFKGATYTKHPVSSGPYMIQSYTQNKQITFVKNPNWSQATDTIRKPLVDKVVLTVDTNPVDIDDKLAAGQADANASTGVAIAFQSKILQDPTLKANADDPIATAIRYMAVMQSVIPNVHCRRAIFYAFDKTGFQRAYGGPTAGGLTGQMFPLGIAGYKAGYDPYPSGSSGSGDLDKAKQELQACGKPNGFTTKFAYGTPSTSGANAFKAEQTALARVGIKVTPDTQDSSTYYSTFIGSPQNVKNQGIGIAVAGWGADFPDPIGWGDSIVNGKAIKATGNSNYASLNDPTVNAPFAATSPSTADWEKAGAAVMDSATYLPILAEKTLYYRNPRLMNVTSNNALAFGIYDWVNIGVS